MPSPAHAPDRPTAVTLLFCHGAGFSREIWAPILARLERSPLLQRHRAAGGHVELVTFDLPYHGANRDVSVAPVLHLENPDLPRVTHPAMEWPVWMTAAVLRQVEQLQQKASSMIIGIGHSMGAAAMWNVEALHPGTFAGLVLFEPISLLNSFPGSDVMLSLVVASCLKRRAQWESREEAKAEFLATRSFSRWHRESLDAYVQGSVVPVDPTNNAIDPDAKFALACHPHIEAAFYCGQILRHSPEDVKRVRCRIVFQYGERTMLFYPHLRQPLADKYPHLYELGEAVPKATHTLIVEDPDTCASRIVESLAKFTPFHQPQATAQSRL